MIDAGDVILMTDGKHAGTFGGIGGAVKHALLLSSTGWGEDPDEYDFHYCMGAAEGGVRGGGFSGHSYDYDGDRVMFGRKVVDISRSARTMMKGDGDVQGT